MAVFEGLGLRRDLDNTIASKNSIHKQWEVQIRVKVADCEEHHSLHQKHTWTLCRDGGEFIVFGLESAQWFVRGRMGKRDGRRFEKV